ncbi:TonB-dependent receptor [Pseudoduganella violaceinigra]|uniref:TonB-dependent receptor n=1 Tax=Pseudoduganella violaceinigra TaxID=246602 RepID=UPI00068423B2|nr:TonB-dependent receptor [Pseudoduganella violaceinigra]
MMNHKRLRLTQIAFSLSLVFAAPAFAQNTTSAIGGRISASDGKPAAGATVQVLHVESGSVNTVTTDAEGRYVARGLRAGGPYTIIITKNGVSEKRENVFVELAETAAVDATIGQAMQTVTIAGSSAARAEKFNKSTQGTVTSITAADLEIQGSIQRSLQDYARMDPRVSQTDKERNEISVAGQNSRFNSLTIDGVAVNDTFGLEGSGSPFAKQPISIDAIQSSQINVANYDVTQKGYTGANINAVTKSGTNKFKGSVYTVFRNQDMSGDRYNASTDSYSKPADSKTTTNGMTFGGPIIKDKLFFFTNYEKYKSSLSSPAYGPLGSSLTNVGVTTDSIAQAKSIALNKWGMDGGTEVVTPAQMNVTDKLVKVDWNINDDHRMMVRWSKTVQSEPIFAGFDNNSLSLSSNWYTQGKTLETKVAQVFSDWTPNFSTEIKWSRRDYDSVPTLNAVQPAVSLNFTGANPAGTPASVSTNGRFLRMGTDFSRQRNVLGTKTDDIYVGANWNLGSHELKFGADMNKNEVNNIFLQNVYGNYTFSCVSGLPYTFLGGASATAANCSNNDMMTKAVLENFSRGRPSSFSVQIPAAGRSFDDAIAHFTLKDTGIFVQDTWTVTDRLTVNAGLRVDMADINERPTQNSAVAAAYVAGNPVGTVRATGGFGLDNTNTIDGQKLWQPRAGFNYKVDHERPTQIRGGAGLFQGVAMSVWMANPYQNNGVATRTVVCSSSTTACGDNNIFNPDVNKQPTSLPGSAGQANVDALAKGFRQPSVWKANLAFDHELPWDNIVFTAEWLSLRTKDGLYYQNLNLGEPTRYGMDGRALYYTNVAYKPECWSATGTMLTNNGSKPTDPQCSGARAKALSNANFGNVLVATNTKEGHSNLATLSLSRPLIGGYGWSMSYTYTDAKEVSPLQASTSGSTYGARGSFNPNEDTTANSQYLVRDRFAALVNFRKAFFGNYRTTFGLNYEGRSGKPYNWTFNNDANGDGISSNDLMYIPRAPGSGDVIFAGDTAASHANEDKFWATVDQYRSLRNAKGGVVKRGDSYAPWTNNFDLRIGQEIPGFMSGHKGLFRLDIMNFGNLLNKKWGRINEVGYSSSGGVSRSFVDFAGIDSATGKYVYRVRDAVEDYDVRQVRGESQWSIQASFKYEF